MTTFDFEEYLDRINYSGEIARTLEVLTRLQKLHLLNIPFENLDIHYGIPIELEVQKLYNKIVLNKRGGFCYELNGLFFELLRWMGFEAKRISARVYAKENGYSQEYDHTAIIVNINDKEYLADVGFGEFAFAPLRIEFSQIRHDQRGRFLFDKFNDDYLRVSKMEDDKPIPEYIFTRQSRALDEFSGMCQYHQTSPQSHFKQKKMISLPTEDGRITLTEDKLKITNNGVIQEEEIKNEHDFERDLFQYFGIEIKNVMKYTN